MFGVMEVEECYCIKVVFFLKWPFLSKMSKRKPLKNHRFPLQFFLLPVLLGCPLVPPEAARWLGQLGLRVGDRPGGRSLAAVAGVGGRHGVEGEESGDGKLCSSEFFFWGLMFMNRFFFKCILL